MEHVAVARVTNLPKALKHLKSIGFWVLGAEAEADADLFDAPQRLLEGDLVLALGAEGKGLRPGVRAAVDAFLRIPMAGRVASLNVATAAAVFLFEWRRRSGSDVSPAVHPPRRSGPS
jgi:23S rRNA (guanosine2251-2'-O)-methyltransferase